MPAGTGQSEPDVTEIRELEERLDNLRIQTSDDLAIRGNAWQGYALNTPECPPGVISTPVGTGACCAEDGSCTITTEAECDGTYQGNGTVCDPNPCPLTGACCIDGVCSILSSDDCATGGGNYLGNGSTCDGVDCTVGACCFDTFCEIDPESNCTDDGGVYQGDGSTCDPNPCDIGACCIDDECSITSAGDCDSGGGTFIGGASCEGVDCVLRACCTEGVCTFTTEEDCGGVWLPDVTNCDNPCDCLVANAGYEYCGFTIGGLQSCCNGAALCCACSGGLPPAVCCDPESQHCGDCSIGGATCEAGMSAPESPFSDPFFANN